MLIVTNDLLIENYNIANYNDIVNSFINPSLLGLSIFAELELVYETLTTNSPWSLFIL